MTYTVSNFIHGKKVNDKHTVYHDIHNPALGKVVGRAAFATASDIQHAIQSSHDAFLEWSKVP